HLYRVPIHDTRLRPTRIRLSRRATRAPPRGAPPLSGPCAPGRRAGLALSGALLVIAAGLARRRTLVPLGGGRRRQSGARGTPAGLDNRGDPARKSSRGSCTSAAARHSPRRIVAISNDVVPRAEQEPSERVGWPSAALAASHAGGR